MSFHVGQRVVCVEDQPKPGTIWSPGTAPEKGRVYTIARVFTHPSTDGLLVELVEIRRSDATERQWGHRGYGAYRFRPLDERRLDIFREMLVTPPKEPVSA